MGTADENDFETEEEEHIDLCAQTIRDLVQHPVFDAIILATICVNAVMMVRIMRFFHFACFQHWNLTLFMRGRLS